LTRFALTAIFYSPLDAIAFSLFAAALLSALCFWLRPEPVETSGLKAYIRATSCFQTVRFCLRPTRLKNPGNTNAEAIAARHQ
jgi:hypothetical protein